MRSLTPQDAKVSVQLRLPLLLRNRLVTKATNRDISLNQLCIELLEEATK
jgi:predicted HicB family RNase H-like nuclease